MRAGSSSATTPALTPVTARTSSAPCSARRRVPARSRRPTSRSPRRRRCRRREQDGRRGLPRPAATSAAAPATTAGEPAAASAGPARRRGEGAGEARGHALDARSRVEPVAAGVVAGAVDVALLRELLRGGDLRRLQDAVGEAEGDAVDEQALP